MDSSQCSQSFLQNARRDKEHRSTFCFSELSHHYFVWPSVESVIVPPLFNIVALLPHLHGERNQRLCWKQEVALLLGAAPWRSPQYSRVHWLFIRAKELALVGVVWQARCCVVSVTAANLWARLYTSHSIAEEQTHRKRLNWPAESQAVGKGHLSGIIVFLFHFLSH